MAQVYKVNVPQKKTVTEIDVLKETMITAARVLENENCYDYIGHVSARIPGTDRWMITPHLRELSFREATARDVVTMDLSGKQVDGQLKHPSEFWLHNEIYARRPDVNGIIHVHPEYCVMAGLAEVKLVPLYVTSGIFAKGIPLFKEPALIYSKELGERCAATLGECNAALLKWHGAVVVAPTIEESVMATIALEKLARLTLGAMAAAGGKPIEEVPPGSQIIDPVLLSPWAGWRYCLSRLNSK